MSSELRLSVFAFLALTSSCASDSGSSSNSKEASFALEAYSLQGASKDEILSDPSRLITFSIAEDGQAVAYDYNEYGYDGPSGTELARLQFTKDELIAARDKVVVELDFMTIDDAAIDTEAKKLAAECNCTMEYGGDVGTMLINVTSDGVAHSSYWRSDLMLPEGKTILARTHLDSTRSFVLELRRQALGRGTGLIADALVAANAEFDKQHADLEDLKGDNCWFDRDNQGTEPVDTVYCNNYAETDDLSQLPSPRYTVEVLVTGGTIGAAKLNTYTD